MDACSLADALEELAFQIRSGGVRVDEFTLDRDILSVFLPGAFAPADLVDSGGRSLRLRWTVLPFAAPLPELSDSLPTLSGGSDAPTT